MPPKLISKPKRLFGSDAEELMKPDDIGRDEDGGNSFNPTSLLHSGNESFEVRDGTALINFNH